MEPTLEETEELNRVLMSDGEEVPVMISNLRSLYQSEFLASPGALAPEDPTEGQLQGVFSIDLPYTVTKDLRSEGVPGRVNVNRGQTVQVLDSKRDDWWLVGTSSNCFGWVDASCLRPVQEDLTSQAPLWIVLASYEASEDSMVSVTEGQLVQVIDSSRDDWYLVRTVAPHVREGWMPANYLRPQGQDASPYGASPRLLRTSSGDEGGDDDDSDSSSDLSDHPVTCISPEVTLEIYDDEDRRQEAFEKRSFVVSELITSEREYVEKLHYCLDNYLSSANIPKSLRSLGDLQLFKHLQTIFEFHKNEFLGELERCWREPEGLGDVFVSAEESLVSYISYCQCHAQALEVYRDLANNFDELRARLHDRLDLPDYLILPVQRITKYSLLLEEFRKQSIKSGAALGNIKRAIEVTKGISMQANNAIHLSMVSGLDRLSLGELALQEVFGVIERGRHHLKDRRVFLFAKALVVTKRRRDSSTDRESYVIKDKLMLQELSMTQGLDPERKSLVIYEMTSGTKTTLKASRTSVRDLWLSRANELIQNIKAEAVHRPRSSSEPVDSLAPKNTLQLSSSIRKSTRRPTSSTGHRFASVSSGSSSSSQKQRVSPGTRYIAMECIVMEGGDDVTLEPGDEVELVRVEDSGALRVRTTDDHPIEGVVPSSYLRCKDTVREGAMEASPQFTMPPTDASLLVGTTATLSCAFNGYPPPGVQWDQEGRGNISRREGDERVNITSCGTSSVLEITRLCYLDTGTYSCTISNTMGRDSAHFHLSVYGPPTQPPRPAVSKVQNTSVKLKWDPPDFDGSSPILSYQIEILQNGFDEWQPIVQQCKNHFTVKSLEPNTAYLFRIIAFNSFGPSRPSEASEQVLTKGKGWLVSSPAIKKKTSFVYPEAGGRDYTDMGFEEGDELSHSPQPHFVRKASVGLFYDIQPEEIGRGRYGIVHKCANKQSGIVMAAKHVRLKSKRKNEIRKEVEILRKVAMGGGGGRSPNLLEFQDAFEMGRNLIIITELVPDGELLERILEDNDLTERVVVQYVAQLLSALETIHRLNIVHLDIKPENLLLSGVDNPTLKLIDFGSARDISMGKEIGGGGGACSSPEFSSPEVVSKENIFLQSDMWSVGVLTYILLSGLSPFFVDNMDVLVFRIKEAIYSFKDSQFDHISQEAKDFVSYLLQKSPEYRMSASQALEHSWISMLNSASSSPSWPMVRLDISRLKNFHTRRKWQTTAMATDANSVFGFSTSSLSPQPTDTQPLREVMPRLWDGPSQLRVAVGDSVTISWKLEGHPHPSLLWEHLDQRVVPSGNRVCVGVEGGVASLRVSEALLSDEGRYTCCAVNSLGSALGETALVVMDKPGPPTVVNGVILGSYNTALVSWLPPAYTGNSPILRYTLEWTREQFNSWEVIADDIESAAHVVENLLPGVAFVFRVSATNEVGTSGPSNPSVPLLMDVKELDDADSPTVEEVKMKSTPFTIEYNLGEEIGRGAMASVHLCTENSTDRTFVAKVVSTSTDELHQLAMNHYEFHRTLVHPRVPLLESAFEEKDDVILVMEHLSGGDLSSYLSTHKPLTELQSSSFSKKLLEGLQFMHELGMIHANLHPGNILLTGDQSELKITGFTHTRYSADQSWTSNLTEQFSENPQFMSPEVIGAQAITTAADIWSVGTIAFLMVTGDDLFDGSTPEEVSQMVSSLQFCVDQSCLRELSAECNDFVFQRAVVMNPRRRLSAPQCLRHRWLQLTSLARSRRLSSSHDLLTSPTKYFPSKMHSSMSQD